MIHHWTVLMTGAHVTPAVALAQAIREKIHNARIIYAGRRADATEPLSIERAEIERVGGHFRTMTSGKLHRFFTVSQLLEFAKLPIGVIQAFRLLLGEKPNVVVSFGGYLAIPIVVGSRLLRIPIVLHEQTAAWGLSNRICRRWADAVAVSWPHLVGPGIVLTGNPLPKEIISAGKSAPLKNKEILYITEGSQASKVISQAVRKIMSRLLLRFEVYHQTKYPADQVDSERYHSKRWFPTPRHAKILRSASIAISRAGANTVTYHAYFGIPSVLIPLPHAGGNEQMKNAQLLADTGLARILPQAELSGENLLAAVTELSSLPERVKRESRIRARRLVRTDAASALADLVLATSRK